MKKSGQTALILILLSAAALIFLAISLNWGRVSQTKGMLSTAAYQSASLLASEVASYGEAQKQQHLGGVNVVTTLTGLAFAIVIFAAALIAIFSGGLASLGLSAAVQAVLTGIAIGGAVFAALNIALQLTWIQPGTSEQWNNLQKNQPDQQQFFENGMVTALQGTVNDQANITDYFDWNGNGIYGNNLFGSPKDNFSRFALFYGERRKMLAQPLIPQVVDFYNQLGLLVNGSSSTAGLTNPSLTIGDSQGYSQKLNDACTDSSPYESDGVTPNPGYNPYCDPCCQLIGVPDPYYNKDTPNPFHPSPTLSIRPTDCPTDTGANGAPVQCYINNPYNSAPGIKDSPYTLLYDPVYQEYGDAATSSSSVLDNLGRDEQENPFYFAKSNGNYPYMTPKGGLFPNGIYPFFWLMRDYSPEVDNINPQNGQANSGLLPPQWHWCTAQVAPDIANQNLQPPWPPNSTASSSSPLTAYPPLGLTYLGQLTLPNGCSGPDCCVNYLDNWIAPQLPGASASVLPAPSDCKSQGFAGPTIDVVGSKAATAAATNAPNPALDPSFGEGYDPNTQADSSCAGTATGRADGQCSWTEGDDQMCSVPPQTGDPSYSWPYNSATAIPNLPDGICEWTGPPVPASTDTAAQIESSLPPASSSGTYGLTWPASSVDKLDDAMHTLSDFTDYADTFLGQDLGTLSATFKTWYPQAATWIAPQCTDPRCNVDISAACGGSDTAACQAAEDAVKSCPDHTCNPGSNGRLLSLYTASGYPNVTGASSSKGPVNEFSYWNNNVMTPWINNDYTGDASVWCVPPEATLLNENAQVEDAWLGLIGTSSWGAMPRVLACMAYNGNAGGAVLIQQMTISTGSPKRDVGGAIYNYQQCLNALIQAQTDANGKPIPGTNACTDSQGNPLPQQSLKLPDACDPRILGRDLLHGVAPPFIGSTPQTTVYDNTNNPQQTIGLCTQPFIPLNAVCSCLPTTCPPSESSPPVGNFTGTPPSGACTCSSTTGGGPLSCSNAAAPPDPTQTTAATAGWQCTDTNGCQVIYTVENQSTDGGGCNPNVQGGYAAWVQNSLNLFKAESYKFDLRAKFLSDIYSRAQSMQSTFQKASADMSQFLTPCSGANCSSGGPAAQLIYAQSLPQPTSPLPNAVIYGWLDKTLANSQTLPPVNGTGGGTGYAHLVKVTAYSPGRNVNPLGGGASFVQSVLPWVRTYTSNADFTRSYELANRDGYVYVSIKRWDENHSNSVTFPNGRPLWQTSFQNPAAVQANTGSASVIGNGSLGSCTGIYPGGSNDTFGWGLEPITALGLQASYANITPLDQKTLAQAFMLNDEGDGKVDPSALNNAAYSACLSQVNQLLAMGTESHACMEYMATPNAAYASSPAHDHDYSLKFVDCKSIPGYPPQDDLTGGQ